MATPANPLDPLAEIATPAALTDWLDGLDCADLAPGFIARGLLGQALLDAEPELIAELAGPDQRLITRQVQRLRGRQSALTPALTRAELAAGADHCRALGRDWQAQPWLPGLLATWPGPVAHEVQALGDLLDRGQAAGALWQLKDLAEVLIKVPALIHLLDEAERELGRLDMFSGYVPNIDLFIRMHVLKEATQSSRIEGTRTNIAEALQAHEEIALDRRDDWEEVQNYVAAMNEAVARLAELPLCARLIRDTHRPLLAGVCGPSTRY